MKSLLFELTFPRSLQVPQSLHQQRPQSEYCLHQQQQEQIKQRCHSTRVRSPSNPLLHLHSSSTRRTFIELQRWEQLFSLQLSKHLILSNLITNFRITSSPRLRRYSVMDRREDIHRIKVFFCQLRLIETSATCSPLRRQCSSSIHNTGSSSR